MRKLEGHRQLAAAMGETVCEQVRWATGSCTRDGCSLGIGDGSTIGGVTTLVGYGRSLGIGYGSTLVGGTTLGGGTTIGGGAAVGVADGGASAILVFHWAKRSRRLDISDSCLWWIFVEAYLMV